MISLALQVYNGKYDRMISLYDFWSLLMIYVSKMWTVESPILILITCGICADVL